MAIQTQGLLEALRHRHPRHDIQDLQEVLKFMDGEVIRFYIVTDYKDGTGSAQPGYAYVEADGVMVKNLVEFSDIDDVLRWVVDQYDKKALETRKDPFRFEVVSASIAAVIVVSIAAIVVTNVISGSNIAVPDVLSNALTVILGFYFGSQVVKAANNNDAPKKSN